jgi:hypothetical protein
MIRKTSTRFHNHLFQQPNREYFHPKIDLIHTVAVAIAHVNFAAFNAYIS